MYTKRPRCEHTIAHKTIQYVRRHVCTTKGHSRKYMQFNIWYYEGMTQVCQRKKLYLAFLCINI